MYKFTKTLSVIFLAFLSVIITFAAATMLVSADGESPSAVNSQVYDWCTAEYSGNEINLSFDADCDFSTVTKSDVTGLKSFLVNAIKEIVTEQIVTESADADTAGLEQIESYLNNRLAVEEELNKYLDGEYDTLLRLAVSQYAQENEVDYEEIRSRLTDITEELIAEYYQGSADYENAIEDNSVRIDSIVSTVEEGEGSVSLTTGEIINLTQTITVNGYLVYDDGSLLVSGIKNLLFSFPLPSEIAEYTDEQMNYEFNISLETTGGHADVNIKVGFTGNCSEIRTAAEFIANHVDFSYEDGIYNVSASTPETFAELLSKLVESPKFAEDIKNRVFSVTDISEGGTWVTGGYTYAEIIELLKTDEYKQIFAEAYANNTLFTKQTVRNAIEGFGGFDKCYDRIVKYGSNLFDLLPERYKNKTLLDFYSADGALEYSGTITVNVANVLNKIESFLENTAFSDYISVVDGLFALIDQTEYSITVNADVALNSIAKLTYNVNGEDVRMAVLPEGASVAAFAPADYEGYEIIAWADAEGTECTVTTDSDAVLYAVIDFALTEWVDGEQTVTLDKDYDGETSALSVQISGGALNSVYSYQWYKDGVEIAGAVQSSYTVQDVADSGEYYCTVTSNTYGYVLSHTSQTITVSVNQAVIDISGYSWDYAQSFVYDGQEKSVALTGVDAKLNVNYVNAAATNAGTYNAQAEITVKDEYSSNYTLSGNANPVVEWTIEKARIDFTGVLWDYTSGSLTYNGNLQTVCLALSDGVLPAGLTLSYSGNTGTDAGEYIATVALSDSDNYVLINFVGSLVWQILPQSVDASGFEWNYSEPFVYDSQAHTVELIGLPAYVTVAYTDNSKTEVGSYTAKALLTSTDANYAISGTVSDCVWQIVASTPSYEPQTYANPDNTVIVVDNTGAADGLALSAEEVSDLGDVDLSVFAGEGETAVPGVAYDVHFAENGTETAVSGQFTVKLLIPENLRDKNIKVIHIGDNGTVTEVDNFTREGDYVVFTATGFSVYAIIEIQASAPAANLLWLWILLAILAVIIIALIIILICRRIRNGKGGDDGSDNQEVLAEDEAEKIQEEALTEEVEEPQEPVQETEETQEPVQEAVEEEAHPLVADVTDTAVPEVEMRTVYDRSFLARLSQSNAILKNYYSQLKNYILSYQGVKSRVSWSFDSFNKGRTKCVKLAIRGKTLIMYIALDPNSLNVNKYHHEDVSDIIRYEAVPTKLKIRSDRALKYAKELVAVLMEQLGLTRVESEIVEYSVPYEATEKLIDKGLIKVKQVPASTFYALRRGSDEEDEYEEGESVVVAGTEMRTVYQRSFTAKLSQSGKEIKNYFNEIKYYILSYNKVRSRVSWSCESFSTGRSRFALLSFRGKTLVMYIATDPEKLNVNKYHHKNVSGIVKYSAVPTMLKIKSNRGLQYAKELIAALMSEFCLAVGDKTIEKAVIPVMSTKQLLNEGLIKIKLVPARIFNKAEPNANAETKAESVDAKTGESLDTKTGESIDVKAEENAEAKAESVDAKADESGNGNA